MKALDDEGCVAGEMEEKATPGGGWGHRGTQSGPRRTLGGGGEEPVLKHKVIAERGLE